MRRQRLTITLTLVGLVVSALAATAAAAANPLLSGYGGPGEGNQAILGSALLGGPTGGGGSTSGGAGAEGSGPTAASTDPTAAARTAQRAHAPVAAGAGSRDGKASPGRARPYAPPPGLTSTQGRVADSQAVVLSGTELLYVLLALGALVLTGALTRRLARQPR